MKKPTAEKKSKGAPVKSGAVKSTSTKVVAISVDGYPAYCNAGRFPRAEFAANTRKAFQESSPEFTRQVYMLVSGSNGKLCRAVETDEKGQFYRVPQKDRPLIGHIPSLADTEKKLKVELLTTKELLTRVLHGKTKTHLFKNRATGEEVQVVLLNPMTESYFVGVTVDAESGLRVINMEPNAKYNAKPVQWILIRDIADGKLVTKLTNCSTKAIKVKLAA